MNVADTQEVTIHLLANLIVIESSIFVVRNVRKKRIAYISVMRNLVTAEMLLIELN